MKTLKLGAIVLGAGIAFSSLVGCSNNNSDQFYNDSTNVLEMIKSDIVAHKPYSNDQLDTMKKFIDNYKNLDVESKQFEIYMDTIRAFNRYADTSNTLENQ